jgi:preprotein translocase subunit YajC
MNMLQKFLLISASMLTVSVANAQDAAAPAVPAGSVADAVSGAAPQSNMLMSLAPLLLMFGVFYFLVIRPQGKREKQTQSLQASLKKGDEVLTRSGILATVVGVADKVVTLELSTDVRIKMLKREVVQVLKGGQLTGDGI